MAAKEIVSLLHTLTSDEFIRCNSFDNREMEALVAEYFTGNDVYTDNESSTDTSDSKRK